MNYRLQPTIRPEKCIRGTTLDPKTAQAFVELAAAGDLSARATLAQLVQRHAQVRQKRTSRLERFYRPRS